MILSPPLGRQSLGLHRLTTRSLGRIFLAQSRALSTVGSVVKPYYVTTPIFYPNAGLYHFYLVGERLRNKSSIGHDNMTLSDI
jgi:hypothetical protein